MLVIPVPPELVHSWDDVVLPQLKRVERFLGGRTNAEHLLQACIEDRMLLWIITDLDDNFQACVVTQVSEYPLANVLSVVACAGDGMKYWLDPLLVIIRDYAKKKNCTIWEIWARPAWKRVLRKLNPRELLVVLDGEV